MSRNSEARREAAVTFSRNLRKRMFEEDRTRRWLARESGVSISAIDNYMVGRVEPGAWSIVQIANALNCTTDMLLGLEDE